MSLYISSLNSGSNGNCYYIGNSSEAILVDAGLTCKETEKRMQLLGLKIESVKGLFISHEHTDHIKGMNSLAEKYNLPVFISSITAKHSSIKFNKVLINHFSSSEQVTIGSFQVTPFAKYHDASDPHSFIVSSNQIKVGVFTDIGRVCESVKKYFNQCNAVFLEANYDCEMLEKGKYPLFLKNRIKGGNGHLSNQQAIELFNSNKGSQLSHLLLSHLSRENNCPLKAKELFTKYSRGTEIIIASRYNSTPVYKISATASGQTNTIPTKNISSTLPLQLSIF